MPLTTQPPCLGSSSSAHFDRNLARMTQRNRRSSYCSFVFNLSIIKVPIILLLLGLLRGSGGGKMRDEFDTARRSSFNDAA